MLWTVTLVLGVPGKLVRLTSLLHNGATNSIFEKKAITKLIKDSQEMKKKKLMERA